MRDTHTHCPCVGVWLCPACHGMVHQSPQRGRDTGFILARSERAPWLVPFKTPWGWVLPDCDGGWKEAL